MKMLVSMHSLASLIFGVSVTLELVFVETAAPSCMRYYLEGNSEAMEFQEDKIQKHYYRLDSDGSIRFSYKREFLYRDIFLFYLESKGQWLVGRTLGGNNAGIYVADSAEEPHLVQNTWKYYNGTDFVEDPSIKFVCVLEYTSSTARTSSPKSVPTTNAPVPRTVGQVSEQKGNVSAANGTVRDVRELEETIKSMRAATITAAVVPTVILIIVCAVVGCCYWRDRQRKRRNETPVCSIAKKRPSEANVYTGLEKCDMKNDDQTQYKVLSQFSQYDNNKSDDEKIAPHKPKPKRKTRRKEKQTTDDEEEQEQQQKMPLKLQEILDETLSEKHHVVIINDNDENTYEEMNPYEGGYLEPVSTVKSHINKFENN